MLEFPLEAVRAAHGMRRLVRRGVPFRTDTYEMGDHLIWGATARMVADLLDARCPRPNRAGGRPRRPRRRVQRSQSSGGVVSTSTGMFHVAAARRTTSAPPASTSSPSEPAPS